MRHVVLSVGTNHALLGIRNAVFARTGYAVISAKNADTAIKAIQSRRIDAVIVGHAVSPSLKEKITASAKDKRLPVIVLHIQPNSKPIQLADANLCGIDGAALIAEVLRGLIVE
jgi:vacuolar-type H+-ATPase subunit F/Vma7